MGERRTCGLIQIWALGADAMSSPESWRSTIGSIFHYAGNDYNILEAVIYYVLNCSSIEELHKKISYNSKLEST